MAGDLQRIGPGLARDWKIGDSLGYWRWIGRLVSCWHCIGGLAMDWQIGTGLAVHRRILKDCRIGWCWVDILRTDVVLELANWSKIGIGLEWNGIEWAGCSSV